jgi:hypothetical protein
MIKRLRVSAVAVISASLVATSLAADQPKGVVDKGEIQLTENEKALLGHYTGDVELPRELLKAYAAFAKVARTASEEELKAHCLPHGVPISSAVRPPESRWYGRDINIPFLRSEDFHLHIQGVARQDDDCYLIRTGSSGIYFVRTHSGAWKIYSYFDKPIQ